MDKAHSLTDKKLEEMEKHLSEIYARSQKELEKKTKKFWADFERKDKAKKKKLDVGEITEADYKKWRQGQLMTGKHWEEMTKTVAEKMVNADKAAAAYVNGKLPEIYALNYNALGDSTSGIKGYSFELVDAATVRNLATSDKTLLPYKTVNGEKAERWNTQKVNAEVMQGIIQGESIPNIAKRLKNVVGMEKASAIRNARTTTTSAENKGRMDSYHDAQKQGIVLKKRWIATHDHRTREEHIELDGQEVDVDEPFENSFGKIMYPGDPAADPANVYNCRCTLVSSVKGFANPETGEFRGLEAGARAEEETKERLDVYSRKFAEWTDEQHENAYNRMIKNAAQEDIIYQDYVGTANSFSINRKLRNDFMLSKSDERLVNALNETINRNAIPENIKGVRYVDSNYIEKVFGVSEFEFDKMIKYFEKNKDVFDNFIGTVVTEKGFMSVSSNVKKNMFTDRQVKLELLIPEGTNGYVTKNFSESEMIFGNGQRYEIREFAKGENKWGEDSLIIRAVMLRKQN